MDTKTDDFYLFIYLFFFGGASTEPPSYPPSIPPSSHANNITHIQQILHVARPCLLYQDLIFLLGMKS
jgi:hypothetical protein